MLDRFQQLLIVRIPLPERRDLIEHQREPRPALPTGGGFRIAVNPATVASLMRAVAAAAEAMSILRIIRCRLLREH
jgi:hypothetical protein